MLFYEHMQFVLRQKPLFSLLFLCLLASFLCLAEGQCSDPFLSCSAVSVRYLICDWMLDRGESFWRLCRFYTSLSICTPQMCVHFCSLFCCLCHDCLVDNRFVHPLETLNRIELCRTGQKMSILKEKLPSESPLNWGLMCPKSASSWGKPTREIEDPIEYFRWKFVSFWTKGSRSGRRGIRCPLSTLSDYTLHHSKSGCLRACVEATRLMPSAPKFQRVVPWVPPRIPVLPGPLEAILRNMLFKNFKACWQDACRGQGQRYKAKKGLRHSWREALSGSLFESWSLPGGFLKVFFPLWW